MPMPADDARRVIRAQCGDRDALEGVLRSIQPTLLRYITRVVGASQMLLVACCAGIVMFHVSRIGRANSALHRIVSGQWFVTASEIYLVGTSRANSACQFNTTDTLTSPAESAGTSFVIRKRWSTGETSYGRPETPPLGFSNSKSFRTLPISSVGDSATLAAIMAPSGST